MSDSRLNWEDVIELGTVLFGALVFCVTLIVVTFGIGVQETAVVRAAESERVEVGNYDELVAALSAAGRVVRPVGEFGQPFFGTSGMVVEVDGNQVLVFEYLNERDRKAESEVISADGTTVGTTNITWTDQPNFWASGRVIVEYLGKDRTMLSLLCNTLGTPVTTHEQVRAE